MNNKFIIISALLGVGSLVSLVAFFAKPIAPQNDYYPVTVSIDSDPHNPEAVSKASPRQRNRFEIASSGITQNQIRLALDEIRTRFDLSQAEEALNELNGLLSRYDSMSHSEKVGLLDAYARYFREHSLISDAIFFYEEILKLPELEQSNRLALLQLLGIIAVQSENWDGFLGYYDRYFDTGRETNWVMTRSLTAAYQRLEDFDAAGNSMLLHMQTGIHPQYDGSNEQYQRRYARYESIPLDMPDGEAALVLAQAMVDQFDKPENWRILSELYQLQGEDQDYSNVLSIAREKGYTDSSGNWLN